MGAVSFEMQDSSLLVWQLRLTRIIRHGESCISCRACRACMACGACRAGRQAWQAGRHSQASTGAGSSGVQGGVQLDAVATADEHLDGAGERVAPEQQAGHAGELHGLHGASSRPEHRQFRAGREVQPRLDD